MALRLLIWDKDTDNGIAGQAVNQKVFGEFFPSHITRERQFIRPIADVPRGFTLKAGTYITLTVEDSDHTPRNMVFGTNADVTVNYAEQLLDTGVSFTAGKDYYIYLCLVAPAGTEKQYTAELKISLNSTYPTGYTADTSRKIGGFHTECANVGTIANHWLSGWNAGDILPYSFWDLSHRPTCEPEGMVYIKELDFWADIYLQSGSGTSTKSVNGGTITDNQTQGAHVEDLFKVGKTPLSDPEFSCAAEGSNQQTNIYGSADPVTTGGHSDTASRRMVSNYGLEDCCGAMWQWLDEQGPAGGSSWSSTDGGKGCVYGNVYALLAGGTWNHSTYCGSRSRYGNHSRLYVYASLGCRGRARSRA